MRNAPLSKSLDMLVSALCRDFERRAELASNPETSHRVDIELRYLNAKMIDAATEVVGDRLSERFIIEIGSGIGFAKSEIDDMSESTYKLYKKRVKENIAKRLYLTE